VFSTSFQNFSETRECNYIISELRYPSFPHIPFDEATLKMIMMCLKQIDQLFGQHSELQFLSIVR